MTCGRNGERCPGHRVSNARAKVLALAVQASLPDDILWYFHLSMLTRA
jgi:hypothetical protein